MLILKGGRIFRKGEFVNSDILITDRIEMIEDSISIKGVETMDLGNNFVIPGFIDLHCHVNGAGGEGGPLTRTLPIDANLLLFSGITTVVGLLGTDGYTRNLIDLLMHIRRLNASMNAFMLTGSYQLPGPTLTGSVPRDIIFVPEVVGVKIALSDHRSSYPSFETLKNLASEVRVSSMLANKKTIITVHMGDGKQMFSPIYEVIEKTEIPLWHFIPTHVDRNEDLLKSSVEYAKMGGLIDLTAHPGKTLRSIEYLLSRGVPIESITVSTDGNGSMPIFDKNGILKKMDVSPVDTLLGIFRESLNTKLWPEIIKTITENPAERLGLRKGRIEEGMDADLLVFDNLWNLRYSISRGRVFSL